MPDLIQKARFIPFRKKDIINMLLNEGAFKSREEKNKFRKVCGITGSIFHFEFHSLLEKLKDEYFPINPDLKRSADPSDEERENANRKLIDKLMLAVPAIAGGIPLLVTKVIPALIVAFIIIGSFFGAREGGCREK